MKNLENKDRRYSALMSNFIVDQVFELVKAISPFVTKLQHNYKVALR